MEIYTRCILRAALGLFALLGIGAASAQTPEQNELAEIVFGLPLTSGSFSEHKVSVAMDGDTAVVGAPLEGTSGAVYIYTRSGTTWAEQQKIFEPNATTSNILFGNAVAIDGDTVVIGAPRHPPSTAGKSYIFKRTAGIWALEQELTAPFSAPNTAPPNGEGYGTAVAVSGDTVAISALSRPLSDRVGAVFVYQRSGAAPTPWVQEAELTHLPYFTDGPTGGATEARFGYSLSLDADTLLVCAPSAKGAVSNEGAAHVFKRGGTGWDEEAVLKAPNPAAEEFCWSVVVLGDTAVVGVPGHDHGVPQTGVCSSNCNEGSVFVFTRTGASWGAGTELRANSPVVGEGFGSAVAWDGNTLTIGAWEGFGNGSGPGTAYVFKPDGPLWVEQVILVPSDGAVLDENFGDSIAVAGDTVLVGASRHNHTPAPLLSGQYQGSAYLFALPTTVTVEIDVGDFLGGYSISPGICGCSGNQSLELDPGTYSILIGGSQFSFDVDVAGNVTNNYPALGDDPSVAYSVSGNTITLNNKLITIDSGDYGGGYFVSGVASFSQTAGTPVTVTLVPGTKRFSLFLDNRPFRFSVDAVGNVVNDPACPSAECKDPDDSYTVSGDTITFLNTTVTFDAADSLVRYGLSGNIGNLSGVSDVPLVPGIDRYLLLVHSAQFRFDVDSVGNVVNNNDSPNDPDDTYSISANRVTFFVSPVLMQPAAPTSWNLNGITASTTGDLDVPLIEGGIYRINANGTFGVFEVLHPCEINTGNVADPNVLEVGATSFIITCFDPTPPDGDADGIPDANDNCPAISNFDQLDQDTDGIGNVCDPDLDGDTVLNDLDNCPDFANSDQADLDVDGLGDVCDGDVDGDSVADDFDNCPLTPNTDQADSDVDGFGDACDPDDDNDSVADEVDNCPNIANTDQTDGDGDGLGDVCDNDADGDGVENAADACPSTPMDAAVTSEGCSGAQFIVLTCDPANFPNHGKYVSCVAHAAKDLVDLGILAPKEKARFVREAAKSK